MHNSDQLETLKATIQSYLTDKEKAVLAVFNVLLDPKPDENAIAIINDYTEDQLLVDVIRKVVNDESSYKNAARALSPFTLRILNMRYDHQLYAFKGNELISHVNVYNGLNIRKYSDAENDQYLNHHQFGLARQIHQIREKALEFIYKSEAWLEATQLHSRLSKSYIKYLSQEINYDKFQSECKTAISKSREVLETHRGWKNILLNLALHIALLSTCGIGNMIALGYAYYSSKPGNRSFFFQLANTDTGNRINKIEQSIQTLNPNHK